MVEKDKMSEIKEAIYQLEADLESSDSDLDREQKELKIKTRKSIRSMKNEFLKKTTFPYLVRALLWDFILSKSIIFYFNNFYKHCLF